METKKSNENIQEVNSQALRLLEQQLKQLSLRKKSHKTREPKQKKQHRSTTQELISHPTIKTNIAFKRKKQLKEFRNIDWKYGKIEKKTHQVDEEYKDQNENSVQAFSDTGYERVIELSIRNSKESLNESFGNEEKKPRGFSFNDIRDDLQKLKKNQPEAK